MTDSAPGDGEVYTPDEMPAKKPGPIWKRPPILAAIGGGVVVLVVVAILLTRSGPPAGPDPVIYTVGHNPFIETQGAACIGMPLGRGTVVYCVDSSSALAVSHP